jgi:hypothetical protein
MRRSEGSRGRTRAARQGGHTTASAVPSTIARGTYRQLHINCPSPSGLPQSSDDLNDHTALLCARPSLSSQPRGKNICKCVQTVLAAPMWSLRGTCGTSQRDQHS